MDPLKELDKEINSFKQKHKKNPNKPENESVFVGAEIVAGVVTGGAIGYYLDVFFKTKILFLLIFIILGLISSLYNIYRKYK